MVDKPGLIDAEIRQNPGNAALQAYRLMDGLATYI